MRFAALLLIAAVSQAPSGMQTISRDMSGIEEPQQSVIRSNTEWAALWRRHAGEKPVPRVDFKANVVVAVFLGTRPSAGYAVEIVGTRREGAALVVEWNERGPEPGSVLAQVLTSPAHIASIPRFSGEIRFHKAAR